MVTPVTTGHITLSRGYHSQLFTLPHKSAVHYRLRPVVSNIPMVFVYSCGICMVIPILLHDIYHYHMDTTASCSHYHMGLWYFTTQVPVIKDIPAVFHVVTSCTTGQYHYHMIPQLAVHITTWACGALPHKYLW